MIKEKVKELFKDTKEITDGGIITIQSVEMAKKILEIPNLANYVDSIIADKAVALLEDNDIIDAEILKENEVANENDIQLNSNGIIGEVKSRITTNIKMSKQLINDTSEKDMIDILNKRISRSMAKVIANGNDKWNGKCLCDVEATLSGDLTCENLRNLMLEMKQAYLVDACFIVAEIELKRLAKEKKENGEYYITFCKETGLYEIFGVPIIAMDILNTKALLVNLREAYKLLVSPNIDLRDFSQDAYAALSGIDGIVISIYADGGIKNTNAIKKLV